MMPKIFAVLIIIAYVVLLYFIVFGKKRKEKKHLDAINAKLQIGTRICTISGICCTVAELSNDKEILVELSCAEGKHIRAKMLRGAIKEVID